MKKDNIDFKPIHVENLQHTRKHGNIYTWEEMCFEALLWHSVVRSEFNSHVIELRGDHFRHFSTTEFAMQFGLRGKTTPNLHIIVFANLKKNRLSVSPDWRVPGDCHSFLKFFSCFHLFTTIVVKLELVSGKKKKENGCAMM